MHSAKPTENEINHDLKPFLKDMLAKKQSAPKGSIDYQVEKLKMVAFIGKFAQRSSPYNVSKMQEPIMRGENC